MIKYISGFWLLLGLAIPAVFFQSIAQTTEYEMLISSRNTSSVKRFNGQTGAYIDDFISPGSGGLSLTQDITTVPDGNILVSGRGNTNVLMYDRVTGAFIQSFTNGYVLDNPTKITFGPDGNLYVSQWGTSHNKVVRFNGNTGDFIDEFTPSLNLALGHTWDAAGNLYVACYGSKDVRKFDVNGNFLGIFTEAGHLQGPTNLWFGGNSSLFVVDWTLGSVLEFNASSGNFIQTFVSGLQNAEGYAFGPDSNLYICDWSQNQIKKYSSQGIFIGVFTSQGNMQAPNSILFRPVQFTSIDVETGSIPDQYSLGQNYPNPFNPTTTIDYHLSKQSNVILEIYNARGQKVRSLINNVQSPGIKSVVWDGRNDRGKAVASGIYLYKIQAGTFIQTKKMLLIQ